MEQCWNAIDRGDEILRAHDGQCTYNVTLRRVRAATVAMYRVIHKSVPPELANSAAQQPRQTQQKGVYQ
jgi:hypothetical protein